MNNCSERIYSNDYYDLIAETDRLPDSESNGSLLECSYKINERYDCLLIQRAGNPSLSLNEYSYSSIPKCYGLANTLALESADIYIMQRYPGLNLSGLGVLMGFIDTGIEYTAEVFTNQVGATRIAAIWDQSIAGENAPYDFNYGTEYRRAQIDEAIASEDPLSIVPSIDEIGHGTSMISIAAGSPIPDQNFTGAAYDCDIAVVKLKNAKQNLKDFYCIYTDEPCYQENDIMTGIEYLERLADELNLPLVLCLGLQTNSGDHDANSPLGTAMCSFGRKRLRSLVVSTGNEANQAHHYKGYINPSNQFEDVELKVDENNLGFTAELWASTPDLFSIAIISPSGEMMPRIPISKSQLVNYRFIFEQTELEVEYLFSSLIGGAQLIQMRFRNAAEGIWILRVYSNNNVTGSYNIWLPIKAFLNSDVFFIRSDPDTTISNLATVEKALSTGSYYYLDNSVSVDSGRGYTRLGRIKPELCSPGVNVFSYTGYGRYASRSGGSCAAAICSGAAALLMEWAVTLRNEPLIDAAEIKSILIRGTSTDAYRTYPNQLWGYGTLNLLGSFRALTIT